MSRPMKAAGVALIGVAIVAAVIGGISALSGDGANEAGPNGTSTQPSTTGGTSAPSTTPSPSTPPPTSTNPSSPTPPPGSTPGQPPASGQPPAPGQQPVPGQPPGGRPTGDQQASNKWVTLRVFNNSTITGLAHRAADDFRGAGWNVVDVSNYSQGVIPATTAYFRPGTDEEAAAKQLALDFGFKAEPRFEGIQSASPGVIVIVTNNYQSNPKGS